MTDNLEIKNLRKEKLLFLDVSGRCTMQEAGKIIEDKLGGSGYFLAETTREVCFDIVANVAKYITTETISLRCFNQRCELRFEKEAFSKEFHTCGCRESEDGDEYLYLENEYLLRKTDAIKIENGGSGNSCLTCREYFKYDNDGFVISVFERFVGLKIIAGK